MYTRTYVRKHLESHQRIPSYIGYFFSFAQYSSLSSLFCFSFAFSRKGNYNVYYFPGDRGLFHFLAFFLMPFTLPIVANIIELPRNRIINEYSTFTMADLVYEYMIQPIFSTMFLKDFARVLNLLFGHSRSFVVDQTRLRLVGCCLLVCF